MRTDRNVGFGDANCRLWRRVRTFTKSIYAAAGLQHDIQASPLVPFLVLKKARENQSTADLALEFMNEFHALSSRLLTMLIKSPQSTPEPGSSDFPTDTSAYNTSTPTLFGIAIHRPVVSILAYETLANPPKLREIAYLHISSSSYEIWNALGIAITVIHCCKLSVAAFPTSFSRISAPGSSLPP